MKKIQRSFIKRLPTLSHLSYLDRLKSLNLELLEIRRLRFELIFYYKIINNLTPLSPSLFQFYYPPLSSRTVLPIIQKPRRASQKLSSTFGYRAIDAWNSLPTSVRTIDALNKFKSALKSIDLTKFLKGDFN